VYPGYFPGQFNRGLCNSDSPRNYPLNARTAMVINTCLAYAIGRQDWAKGVAGAVGSAVFGVVVPNMVMRDRNSPYAFTGKQMCPHDVDATSGTR